MFWDIDILGSKVKAGNVVPYKGRRNNLLTWLKIDDNDCANIISRVLEYGNKCINEFPIMTHWAKNINYIIIGRRVTRQNKHVS